MIPTTVLRDARAGFGLRRGTVRVLSTRFGKVCLAHRTGHGTHTQLRLVRAQADTLHRLESETAWLTHLASTHHLAVPTPGAWRGGGLVSPSILDTDGDPWHAIACSWVAGRHLNRGLRCDHLRKAGALLARLHLANRDAPGGIALQRPHWGMARLFELATGLRDLVADSAPLPPGVSAAQAEALRSAHAAIDSAWRALPSGADHVGLIHTDSHWQNMRWNEHRVGLVDFEDFATSRFMLDIACLVDKVESRPGADRLLAAILDGYHQVRPLPGTAMQDLNVMLAFRRFDYAGWVLSWPRLDFLPWGPDLIATAPAYIARALARRS